MSEDVDVDPAELVQAALDGELIEVGTYQFRDDDNGLKTTYPKLVKRSNQAEAGDSTVKWLDPETGATVTVPESGD